MKHVYNDGGRKEAGYKGSARDCVCRSISIATGLSYKEVYSVLARMNKRVTGRKSARNGIHTGMEWFKELMEIWGFEWHQAPSFYVYNFNHFPKRGTFIVDMPSHYTVVMAGEIHDTYDPRVLRNQAIKGYWKKKRYPNKVPKDFEQKHFGVEKPKKKKVRVYEVTWPCHSESQLEFYKGYWWTQVYENGSTCWDLRLKDKKEMIKRLEDHYGCEVSFRLGDRSEVYI